MIKLLLLIVFGLFLVSSCAGPEETKTGSSSMPRDDAENLTIIAAPGWGERESTLKRFTFLLKEFDAHCPSQKASPADMLAFSYQKLSDIGLGEEEGLLALANTLHRMTVDLAARATGAKMDPPSCAQTFAMYLTLRQSGQSPTEAREGVTAVAGAIYDMAK